MLSASVILKEIKEQFLLWAKGLRSALWKSDIALNFDLL